MVAEVVAVIRFVVAAAVAAAAVAAVVVAAVMTMISIVDPYVSIGATVVTYFYIARAFQMKELVVVMIFLPMWRWTGYIYCNSLFCETVTYLELHLYAWNA